MAFCDHCDGQRFDRARILRLLRAAKREAMMEQSGDAVDALQAALTAVRTMDIPHFERLDDSIDGEIIH
jgi:hypothetical protein